MKKIAILVIIATGSTLLSSLFFSKTQVVFQSLESVTETGTPVFNRVKLIPGWSQDTWLMQQSHKGLGSEFSAWDRLAIIVDKSQRPYQARFYQFAPGALTLPNESDATPFKARCFACHSNGPRAIRPDVVSSDAPISWLNRFRIELWNLRIKSYGKVHSLPGKELPGGAPFRSSYPVLARFLELKSCTRCHSEKGIRMPLKLEQVGTAHFLVKKGFMPPFPFQADPDDISLLERLSRN